MRTSFIVAAIAAVAFTTVGHGSQPGLHPHLHVDVYHQGATFYRQPVAVTSGSFFTSSWSTMPE
jgi:hypothetical protein